MKGYLVDGRGLSSMALMNLAPPSMSEQDVLIDVKACSLNYRDLMIAKGEYTPGNHPPIVPLSDMAGVVIKVGDKVTDFKPGDCVLNAPFRQWPAGTLRPSWASTFVGGGGVNGVLAEQIAYPADALVKIPSFLSFQEAATFTIAGLTAWAAVVTHGKTRAGEWVLLHGTGGVSIFAAQLARSIGARTIMTTSSKEKADFVKAAFGVHATVNYMEHDWIKQVKEITQGAGVNVVVDVVGGETLAHSLRICTYGARVAVIGVLAGQESTIQIRDLLKHQVELHGIFMESTEELRGFIRAVEALQLKPHVDKVFSFDQAQAAYRYLADQRHIGKVVISLC